MRESKRLERRGKNFEACSLGIRVRNLMLFLSLFLNSTLLFSQYKIPEKPSFQTSVYDYANLLSTAEKQQLENKLIRYSDTTSTQIVTIIIEDLQGDDIGILTPKWAQQWGIGQEKEDNGVLILLSEKDRKIWISPGYGVEHKLTAGITGELTRNIIIPYFKAGNYSKGLNAGADAIFEVLNGTYKGQRIQNEKGNGPPFIVFILFIIILIFLISRSNRNNKGGNNGTGRFSGPDLMDIIILSSLGRGGGGGFGGSSGGGFGGGGFGGGFGGGGFSGGGAGGSW